MKTIIAGSRNLGSLDVMDAMNSCPFTEKVTTVVSGTARGVDRAGESWAEDRAMNVVRFPAEWNKYGRGAGHKRNAEMAEFSDALVAVWDGSSPGTKNMIANAKRLGLRTWVWDASLGEGYVPS